MAFEEFYVDDTLKGKGAHVAAARACFDAASAGTHYKYPRRDVERFVESFDPSKLNLQRMPPAQQWLYKAVRKFRDAFASCLAPAFAQSLCSISGGHAIVFGSTSPQYEASATGRPYRRRNAHRRCCSAWAPGT